MEKTPQFNRALDMILTSLKPYSRQCEFCGTNFLITREDIEFYHMLRVPPPRLCPLCRKQRRFGHLMRLPIFFKRPCRAPGHTEDVITIYPPATDHLLYDFSYWHSDAWEATAYGRDIRIDAGFFPQFRTLFFDVPHVPLDRDPAGINAEYTVGGKEPKNAYYSAMPYISEDIYYSFYATYSRDIVDCNIVLKSESCYESVNCDRVARSQFMIDCNGCLDSYFLYDCRNCSYCFLSSGLSNKKYVFENTQLTKEEYERKLQGVNFGERKILEEYRRRFHDLISRSVRRAVWNTNAISSVGDRMTDCRDCFYAFNVLHGENIRYVDNGEYIKDSMDVANFVHSEKLYECVVQIGGSSKFSMYLRDCSFVEYSSECYNCHYCFGCVGLKNKQYHIFNKPYRESEYWERLDGIKTAMLRWGEYGEFFSLRLGLMPYQTSYAQKYFPLDRSGAERSGILWFDEPGAAMSEGGRIRRAPEDVPANIRDVSDAILNDVIFCERTGKPFRIIPQELAFYRIMNIALPTKHPWQRMTERGRFERYPWLYSFICAECGAHGYTIYVPDVQKNVKILCESCYIKYK